MLSKIFDTQQNRRSAVPEVSPWLPSPPETKVTCRYRRSAVVEGACRQVTCVTTMSAWMYMDEENFATVQIFHTTKLVVHMPHLILRFALDVDGIGCCTHGAGECLPVREDHPFAHLQCLQCFCYVDFL